MKRTGLSIQGIKCDNDGSLERRVRDEAVEWDLDNVARGKHYDPAVICAVHIASAAYSHTSVEIQVHIAKYTLLCTLIDDFSVSADALEGFTERMYSGSPQLHPLLDRLVENLRKMKDYYPLYSANRIIKATVGFVDSMAVDSRLKAMTLGPGALNYVTSRRLDNGVGDAYGSFIWDKFSFSDLSSYIQAVP
jgi:hypothetical protein